MKTVWGWDGSNKASEKVMGTRPDSVNFVVVGFCFFFCFFVWVFLFGFFVLAVRVEHKGSRKERK